MNQCLHLLKPVDFAKDDGPRWMCLKCFEYLYRKDGVLAAMNWEYENLTEDERSTYTAWDCTCDSDPLGQCVIPSHQTVTREHKQKVEA